MGESLHTDVEAAKLRANISAFLQNNRGPQSVKAVAAHAGVSNRSAGQTLRHMSSNGLISPPTSAKGGGKAYAWKNGNGASSNVPATTPATTPAGSFEPLSKGGQRRANSSKAPEIELVIGNVLLIAGQHDVVTVARNEKTGRMRVTVLED